MSVYGTRLGSTNSVSIFYFSQERGIVPSLVANAMASIVLSSWSPDKFGRTVVVVLQGGEAAREAAQLFKLGLAVLASGLWMAAARFAIRTFMIVTLRL